MKKTAHVLMVIVLWLLRSSMRLIMNMNLLMFSRDITDGVVDGYTYHRDDNPTVRAVERQIAAMEGSDDCIVCTNRNGSLQYGIFYIPLRW